MPAGFQHLDFKLMSKVIVVPYTVNTDLQEGKYCQGIVFTSSHCSYGVLCKISADRKKSVLYASVVPCPVT